MYIKYKIIITCMIPNHYSRVLFQKMIIIDFHIISKIIVLHAFLPKRKIIVLPASFQNISSHTSHKYKENHVMKDKTS